VSVLQQPVLSLELCSIAACLCCAGRCLAYSSLCCTRMNLSTRACSSPIHVCIKEIFFLHLELSVGKSLGCTMHMCFCAAPGGCCLQRPMLPLHMRFCAATGGCCLQKPMLNLYSTGVHVLLCCCSWTCLFTTDMLSIARSKKNSRRQEIPAFILFSIQKWSKLSILHKIIKRKNDK
jgi:hypothetical protein